MTTIEIQSPIIIIGAPRSGTNMMKDTLVEFEGLTTFPCEEINFIWRYGNRSHPTDEFTPEMATLGTKKYIRGKFDSHLKSTKARRIVEKSCANSLRVNYVNEIFPKAKFIHIVRDGLDVSASALLRRQDKFDIKFLLAKLRYVPLFDVPYYLTKYAKNYITRPFSNDRASRVWGPATSANKEIDASDTLSVGADQWNRCVNISTNMLDELGSDRFIRIKYEEFVGDPTRVFSDILNFLEEPIPNDLEEKLKSIKSSSIGKGRNSLSESQREKLRPIVAKTIEKLGYEF